MGLFRLPGGTQQIQIRPGVARPSVRCTGSSRSRAAGSGRPTGRTSPRRWWSTRPSCAARGRGPLRPADGGHRRRRPGAGDDRRGRREGYGGSSCAYRSTRRPGRGTPRGRGRRAQVLRPGHPRSSCGCPTPRPTRGRRVSATISGSLDGVQVGRRPHGRQATRRSSSAPCAWSSAGPGSLVLFLGGLGVLNIGLVTVRQRIREIGVRRSFGATSGRIFAAVMLESVVRHGAGRSGRGGGVDRAGAHLPLDQILNGGHAARGHARRSRWPPRSRA